MYELPHEMPNDLRLKTLEILGKSPNYLQTYINSAIKIDFSIESLI